VSATTRFRFSCGIRLNEVSDGSSRIQVDDDDIPISMRDFLPPAAAAASFLNENASEKLKRADRLKLGLRPKDFNPWMEGNTLLMMKIIWME
jgi:hypothetical protein